MQIAKVDTHLRFHWCKNQRCWPTDRGAKPGYGPLSRPSTCSQVGAWYGVHQENSKGLNVWPPQWGQVLDRHVRQWSQPTSSKRQTGKYLLETMVSGPRVELQRLGESVHGCIGAVLEACGGPVSWKYPFLVFPLILHPSVCTKLYKDVSGRCFWLTEKDSLHKTWQMLNITSLTKNVQTYTSATLSITNFHR